MKKMQICQNENGRKPTNSIENPPKIIRKRNGNIMQQFDPPQNPFNNGKQHFADFDQAFSNSEKDHDAFEEEDSLDMQKPIDFTPTKPPKEKSFSKEDIQQCNLFFDRINNDPSILATPEKRKSSFVLHEKCLNTIKLCKFHVQERKKRMEEIRLPVVENKCCSKACMFGAHLKLNCKKNAGKENSCPSSLSVASQCEELKRMDVKQNIRCSNSDSSLQEKNKLENKDEQENSEKNSISTTHKKRVSFSILKIPPDNTSSFYSERNSASPEDYFEAGLSPISKVAQETSNSFQYDTFDECQKPKVGNTTSDLTLLSTTISLSEERKRMDEKNDTNGNSLNSVSYLDYPSSLLHDVDALSDNQSKDPCTAAESSNIAAMFNEAKAHGLQDNQKRWDYVQIFHRIKNRKDMKNSFY